MAVQATPGLRFYARLCQLGTLKYGRVAGLRTIYRDAGVDASSVDNYYYAKGGPLLPSLYLARPLAEFVGMPEEEFSAYYQEAVAKQISTPATDKGRLLLAGVG